MTTPRDPIGLSERLRKGGRMLSVGPDLADEAATALDALQGEIRQWANEVARYKAYAEKFEQENDALQARVKELEAEVERNDFNLMVKADAAEARAELAESRATSAEQQRDEAYERAAALAEGLQCRNCNSVVPSGDGIGLCCGRPDYDSISDVPDAIRRLAAGTEKEGK
jgi:hypothetical protein